jgi:hypothetical protein
MTVVSLLVPAQPQLSDPALVDRAKDNDGPATAATAPRASAKLEAILLPS